MARKTRIQELEERCREKGIGVGTWSPGDGITRYRFFTSTEAADYFRGDGDYTALGWKEACAYACGRGVRI